MTNRTLAIDYGEKRIGLAISDENARFALPYEMIENKNLKFVVDEIKKIIGREEINKIVAGLPRSLKSEKVDNKNLDKFVASLSEKTGLEVILFDERMSSKAADKFKMKGDKRESGWRDKVAAAIILQDYLDSENNCHSERLLSQT